MHADAARGCRAHPLPCWPPPQNNYPGHPRFKQPVAARLVTQALQIVYGRDVGVGRGPQLVSAEELPHPGWAAAYPSYRSEFLRNRRFRLHFSSTGSGLDVRIPFTDNFAAVLGAPVNRSAVAGALNRTFVRGVVVPGSVTQDSLEIDVNACVGAGLRVGMPGKCANGTLGRVSQIAGLFADKPQCAVFNREGFPMEPFLYDMPATGQGGMVAWWIWVRHLGAMGPTGH